MLSLWSWLVSHAAIIESFFGGAVVVGVPALLTLRGQREARRLADEKNRSELKAQRKQFCVPLLISIHEFAPVKAELRKAHDNLWARQELIFQAHSYVERINSLAKTANERAAVAGSELSIDPAGQKAMDAFVAYLEAQKDYVEAMLQPLSKLHTRFFSKTDKSLLDDLAKKADDKLTVLEETIRTYMDSPPGAGQLSQNGQPSALSPVSRLVRIVQRRPGSSSQVKP